MIFVSRINYSSPSVGHMSVECVLRLMGDGLHLPIEVCVGLGPITCGLVSVIISVPSLGGT